MDDGDDVQVFRARQIHDPIASVYEFPDIVAFRLRHTATDLRIGAQVLNRIQDTFDKLSP